MFWHEKSILQYTQPNADVDAVLISNSSDDHWVNTENFIMKTDTSDPTTRLMEQIYFPTEYACLIQLDLLRGSITCCLDITHLPDKYKVIEG